MDDCLSQAHVSRECLQTRGHWRSQGHDKKSKTVPACPPENLYPLQVAGFLFFSNKPIRAQTDVHADSLLIGCQTRAQKSSRPPLQLAQSQRRQPTFPLRCVWRAKNPGPAQGGYEVNANTPQSRRPCQRKQIERRRSGGNGKRLAGVNEQSEQSHVWQASGAPSLCRGFMWRRRWGDVTATTVRGCEQQEAQCEGRAAAAALTAAAVEACKQSREWVRGGTETHWRVIHGKRCSREGAVSTFNAGGGGGWGG